MSGEQNEIKARWSAKPSGRAWKDSTRALSLVPLPTPSHFSCPWGVRRVLHAKAGLSSIFRCFTKREAVLQGGTSMDLGYRTVSVCAKSLQSCLTLCNHMDYSPPDSSVHEILQARISNSLPFSPPGIFQIQGSNPLLLHWQADSSPQHHLARPRHGAELGSNSSSSHWWCNLDKMFVLSRFHLLL